MAAQPPVVVECEIRIAARPETIFAFLTDPAKLVRWMGIRAVLDSRPGGDYRVHISERFIASGRFVEIVPFERVVFTWGWEGAEAVPPGASTVEITLARVGGETLVRLRHTGLPADQHDIHAEGWAHYLPRLALAAENREPGPDPWAGIVGA